MSDWRTLGVRPGGLITQVRQTGEDEFQYRHSQDVTASLEHNKALRNTNDGYSNTREFRRAAHIPPIVIEMWKNEGVDIFNPDHANEVARRLNSSDWSALRTADGNLGVSNGIIR